MRACAATIVRIVHAAFVAFMVLAPFTHNKSVLVLHLVVTPVLWLHWLLNDDTCALTLLERHVRGVDVSESFMHAIVSPIYKVRDVDLRVLSWIASIVLWLITLSKVSKADVMAALGMSA